MESAWDTTKETTEEEKMKPNCLTITTQKT